MKRIIVSLLCIAMLLSLSVVGASAAISSNVDASVWSTVELKALYVQSG